MIARINEDTWEVTVYLEDGGSVRYYFASKADVEASVVSTWSKCRGSVQMTSGLNSVVVNHLGSGKRLLFARPLARVEVLTAPTHF